MMKFTFLAAATIIFNFVGTTSFAAHEKTFRCVCNITSSDGETRIIHDGIPTITIAVNEELWRVEVKKIKRITNAYPRPHTVVPPGTAESEKLVKYYEECRQSPIKFGEVDVLGCAVVVNN